MKKEDTQKINVAVVKALLRSLPQLEFASYAALFYDQMARYPKGSKRYNYYEELYTWCKSYYTFKFTTNH